MPFGNGLFLHAGMGKVLQHVKSLSKSYVNNLSGVQDTKTWRAGSSGTMKLEHIASRQTQLQLKSEQG